MKYRALKELALKSVDGNKTKVFKKNEIIEEGFVLSEEDKKNVRVLDNNLGMVKKHPGGRPPKTINDLPDNWEENIINLSKEGMSEYEIRAELGITFHLWYKLLENEKNLFSITIKKAQDLCQGWWMKQGRIALREKDFNSTLWYMNMKNRFGWKDKSENDINLTASINLVDLFDKSKQK